MNELNIKESVAEYHAHCIICGRKDSLMMLAHRVDNKMVGWVYSCSICFPKLAGRSLELQVEDSEE